MCLPRFWNNAGSKETGHATCIESDILSITTTVGQAADARRLADLILEQRLAACVQIEEGLVSLYHWQGRREEAVELRLTIKTVPACAEALRALFAEHHPYELPQFLVAGLQGSPAYSRWVRTSTRPAGKEGIDPPAG